MQKTICPKCKSIPDRQFSNGVFTTFVCYPQCGFIFWKLHHCPNCLEENATILLKKPNFGQKITCSVCKEQMYFFLCPQPSCQAIFYKKASHYSMGQVVTCEKEQCQFSFKNLTCPCGSQFKLDTKEIIYQGNSSYDCDCCKQKLIFTVCPTCRQPEYHLEPLTPGERIRCSSCKQWRKYVPCPFCGRSLEGKEFSFFQPIPCYSCQKCFEFCRCAYNCSAIGFNQLTQRMGPERKCYACKKPYAVVNCGKCHETLFRDQLKPSKEGQVEACPICKHKIEYFYCPCGMFNNGLEGCQNCHSRPTSVNDTIKQAKEKEKKEEKQVLTEGERECKICFANQSTFINEACGHIAMCKPCTTTLLNGNLQNSKACPICRTIGRYFAYKEPIYS